MKNYWLERKEKPYHLPIKYIMTCKRCADLFVAKEDGYVPTKDDKKNFVCQKCEEKHETLLQNK